MVLPGFRYTKRPAGVINEQIIEKRTRGGRRGGGQQAAMQNVQRCDHVPRQARPEYWDVTYNFRGQEHRVQTTAPPGTTVTVNERGEPRE